MLFIRTLNRHAILVIFLGLSSFAFGEETATAVATSATSATSSTAENEVAFAAIQTAVASAVMLLILGIGLYCIKRFEFGGTQTDGSLQLIKSLSVGGKNRVVLVEINGTIMALGVTDSTISVLNQSGSLSPNSAATTSAKSSEDGFKQFYSGLVSSFKKKPGGPPTKQKEPR